MDPNYGARHVAAGFKLDEPISQVRSDVDKFDGGDHVTVKWLPGAVALGHSWCDCVSREFGDSFFSLF